VCPHRFHGQAHLLCSKWRVASLKTFTVPKLELCGAKLLSRSSQKYLARTKSREGFIAGATPRLRFNESETSSSDSIFL